MPILSGPLNLLFRSVPVLEYLREVIHTACEETMKWSMPHFQYQGSILCSMASFRQHCAFGFWLAPVIKDPDGILQTESKSMGHFGRIRSLKDLPRKKILVKYIREAMSLIQKGITRPAAKPSVKDKKELKVPHYFLAALTKNKKALDVFSDFSYSHRKEYVEWVTEAKTEETRQKRIAASLKWLAEGKARNWKYM